ncbi:MAG: right-handed parallel beta-helix repeat-containing protein [Armatimonadetes bacterium]|nr:right-handed parallel beta-helix repeat-containing protein [Armatimonadota bacterium]
MPPPPAACLLLGAVTAASAVQTLYVAPHGSDAGSGRLDAPLATLPAAQEAVRKLKAAGLTQPVEVVLAAGTYTLAEPLTFTPDDSGTEACPITWRASDGAKVVLSGGRAITGWKKRPDGLWSASLPDARDGKLDFRLLRVGDKWATRARHPNAPAIPEPASPYTVPNPRTEGWAFAQYGGEPWERGLINVGVSNVHNVNDKLTWTVRVPAEGDHRVWLRYGHNMAHYNRPEMSDVYSLQVDDGAPVMLRDLPDTGAWNAFKWSHTADLHLPAGEHRLGWANTKGGGINMDMFLFTDDPAWDPAKAIGDPSWWGAFRLDPPAPGRHQLLVQVEACDSAVGPEIQVPKVTPPGTVQSMTYAPGALPRIEDASGAEVHVFIAWGWVNAIVPVRRIDEAQRRIEFADPGAAQDVRMGNRFFLENVREALDAPGEWYLDKQAGELLYLPDSPDFPNQPVVAPLLDRLIVVQGDRQNEKWVEHLRFEGLTFTDTTYNLTREYYTPSDAAIFLSAARDCRVAHCEFVGTGGYACQLDQRTHQCSFAHNHVHDVGQGGAHLVGNTPVQPHHNRIYGNIIERIGRIYKHVAGVYATHGSDNQVDHNRITDCPRYAISFKSQGEDRLSHRNVIEYNQLLRTNLETNDTGAIETLGYEHRDSGNIIRYNLILDSVGMICTADGAIVTPHFTWGVYLDDYSSGTTIYGNIIARTHNGGVCLHGGQHNVIENNVIVEAHDHMVRLQPRDAFMQGSRFEHNIVVWSRPETQMVFCWDTSRRDLFTAWDSNLYFLTTGDLATLDKPWTYLGNWAKWRAAGFDEHSQIADPLFVDAAHDDYRLRPDSPAFKLGFKPIPVAQIGPEAAPG